MDKSILLVGTVSNVAKTIEKELRIVCKALSVFDYVKIYLVESDSTDNTVEILKKIKLAKPDPMINPKYLSGYCPIKTNIHTMEKIKAVVEKLAGSTKANITKTGSQSSNKDSLKEYSLSLTLAK